MGARKLYRGLLRVQGVYTAGTALWGLLDITQPLITHALNSVGGVLFAPVSIFPGSRWLQKS